MKDSHRIIFNSGVTYLRFFITVFLALITTRITLKVLGVDDFGLYNVIGGVVAMVAFLNTALAQATQRFLSFYIGSNDILEVKKVFANSLMIHGFLAIIIFIALESTGVYYINNVLNVEPHRLLAANFLLQFSIISTLLTIISVPYAALLFAHENMLSMALINLLDSILKLGIALFLLYLFDNTYDVLVVFGFLTMIASLINRIVMQIYVRKRYKETRITNVFREFDKNKIREQASFASWNLLTVIGYISRNSGLALVLNAFMGTKINAAFSIGTQISNQARFFSNTLFQAINPQIIKNEGGEKREAMVRLGLIGSRYGTLMILLIGIPLIFNMKEILHYWLGIYPEYTYSISIMMLICIMLNQLTAGMETMIYAIGNIKIYSIIISFIKIMAIPIALIIFYSKIPNPILYIFLSLIAIELATLIFRIVYTIHKKLLSLKMYLQTTFIKIIIPICTYILSTYLVSSLFENISLKIVGVFVSALLYFILIYWITIEKTVKKTMIRDLHKFVEKITLSK